jgi:tetratricopeptide (TPR) repeat protein
MEKERIEAHAETYIKRGKFLDAVAEYQKLLTGKELDIPINNIIGDLYVKANQTKKAVAEFTKVADHYEQKGLYSRSIAIYKRITKLDPEDTEAAGRLADLFMGRGFISDAKKEYRKLAIMLQETGRAGKAIGYFDRLLRIDPKDIESRKILIDLCIKEGKIDRAVEELNTAAAQKILKKDYNKADKFLSEARALKEDNIKTLTSSIHLYLKKDKKKQAFELLLGLLKKNKDNVAALHVLGDLFYDEGNRPKSEELFSRIVKLRPDDVNAKIKLGRIYIIDKQADRAFKIYEPLIDNLLIKHKPSKAIGLLGLILSYVKNHLPSLNKLAAVYESIDQPDHLAIVYRTILKEYNNQQKQKESLPVLERLLELIPKDESIRAQYNRIREKLGITKDKDETDEIIKTELKKIDLYMEQGLILNAESILSQLKLSFPNDQKIHDKIVELGNISSRIKEEKIPDVIKKTVVKDDKIWTSADIFSGTDLRQIRAQEDREKTYFDLSQIIEEELQSIKAISRYPVKGDMAILEKDLGEIVKEFRRGVESKVARDDYESRYTLGIAFLEQELFDEAIEEFKIASGSDQFKMDCYSFISLCHKKKNDFNNAVKWVIKTQALTEKTSDRDWALKYELAELYEAMKETETALKLYNEITSWNPNFRDARRKTKELKT